MGAVTQLVGAVAGAAEAKSSHAMAEVREALGSARKAGKVVAGKSAALRRSIKAHWASMTPAQRKARVKKMLAGRGLKPKSKAEKSKPPTAKSLALKKSIKAHWAKMTSAERAARVKKMLAGRGLKPKS